jgi:hypothetical protein
MNKLKLILISVVALLALGLAIISLNVDKGVGAYNNQYDGVIVSKVLTSSSISTSTATNVTEIATGDFYIDNIIASTDATGLATGTLFQIKVVTPTYGTTTVLSHAVSGLGANQSVDLNSATTKQRVILQDGDKLVAYCTGANCAGAGKIKIDVVLRKASYGAAIFD